MKLTDLTNDTLARVCGRLDSFEFQQLRASWVPFSRALSPSNGALWQDVCRYKYNIHCTPSRASRTFQIRDAADAYMCYTGTWTTVVYEPHHANFASYHAPTNALYAAASNHLVKRPVNNTACELVRKRLAGRATAIDSDSNTVAVALGHSLFVHSTHSLETTGVLAGHTSTIRCLAHFANDVMVASGAHDGTIILHDVLARRELGVLQGHAGPVRELRKGGPAGGATAGLFSTDLQGIKQWDIEMRRCTRTYPGHLGAFDADGGSIYVPTPGRSGTVKVYDTRAAHAVAMLSLPRQWGRQPIEALSEENGALAAAVGTGGVAYWHGQGAREAEPLGYPNWFGLAQECSLNAVLLRHGVAYAAGGSGHLIALGIADHQPQTLDQPCHHDVHAFMKLMHAGDNQIVAVRPDGIMLFDPHKNGAAVMEDSARRAAGPPWRNMGASRL